MGGGQNVCDGKLNGVVQPCVLCSVANDNEESVDNVDGSVK